MRNDTTEIRPTGLRYASKSGGAPYAYVPGTTLSCLRCGRHKPRAEGRFHMLIGKSQFECFGCRPPKESEFSGSPNTSIVKDKA